MSSRSSGHGREKGGIDRQELFESRRPEALNALRELAIIQSAESSNRIEGVTVERDRLRPLVLGHARPRDRSEEEIVGYRKALAWIHEQHGRIPVTPETIRKLHGLAQGGFSGDAGEYKKRDANIIELLPNGRRRVRFVTTPAEDVSEAVDQLCLGYRHVLEQDRLPPLLAIGSFVLDLLCIHPFRDGNGRVSRLVTLLLLYLEGYRVGQYVSLARVIEETKHSYYDALHAASQAWHEGEHDCTQWWSYLLSTLRQAYREFEQELDQLSSTTRGAKRARVERAIEQMPGSFAAAELAAACPGVSRELLRKVIREHRDRGRLEATSRGRGARWRKTEA